MDPWRVAQEMAHNRHDIDMPFRPDTELYLLTGIDHDVLKPPFAIHGTTQ
jgi:hypothetical protein